MNPLDSNPLVPAPRHQAEGAPIKLVPRPAALSATPGVMCLLKALRRRWLAALCLGVLTAGLLGGAIYLIVPRAKYTATATLHIATKQKRIMFDPQERETDYRTYQKTQLSLLKNLKVIAHALAKPEVAALRTIREQADPEEWLDQNLKADFPQGSEVLQVALSGDYPEDLSTIVNSVIQSYMTVMVEAEKRERVARLDQLKSLSTKYETDLKLKRQSLRDLASSVGLTDEKALGLAQQFKAQHIGVAQQELTRAALDLKKAQSELAVIESAAPAPRLARPEGAGSAPESPQGTLDHGVEMDQRVRDQKERLRVILDKKAKVERRVRNAVDPSRVQVNNEHADALKELNNIRKLVAKERATQAARNGGQVGDDGQADEFAGLSELARARSKVAVLKSYCDILTRDIDALRKDVKETTDKGLDLESERGAIAVSTEVARKVASEVEAVQVELNAPERIEILAKAKPPNKKDELRKLKAAGGGALGAFVCALLGVSFWEFRARRIGEAQEIVSGLGMRLVGTIPAQPRKGRLSAPSEIARRWQSRLVESVDAMRALLLHASRNDDTRVVMVASALKGEGKTSLACHLATSLARGGRKTLLIDGDLRSPACHRLFDVPVDPGLCEVLRGDCAFEDAVHEGQDFAPAILTAGRLDAFALQSLSQDGLRGLLDDLRTRYDFIVVDSAPVLPVADSLLIGQAVDAVIFSVMREVSRLPMVYEAHERLSALGVRMIGAVVAGVQDATHSYYEYPSQLIA